MTSLRVHMFNANFTCYRRSYSRQGAKKLTSSLSPGVLGNFNKLRTFQKEPAAAPDPKAEPKNKAKAKPKPRVANFGCIRSYMV